MGDGGTSARETGLRGEPMTMPSIIPHWNMESLVSLAGGGRRDEVNHVCLFVPR